MLTRRHVRVQVLRQAEPVGPDPRTPLLITSARPRRGVEVSTRSGLLRRRTMARAMRRVVTGHDAQGKSVFVMDGPSPHVLELPGMPGLALINLWVTDDAPADNA